MTAPENGRAPLLEVRNLTVKFGGLVALSRLNMAVQPDAIAGLIGPNGAGKTTLFNIVSGFLHPTEGDVFFKGGQVTGVQPYRLTEKGISRTFQNTRVLAGMTVLHNVQLGFHAHMQSGLPAVLLQTRFCRDEEKRTRAQALELLKLVGLEKHADALARNLPYGLQRRLEIARALATQAELLLLDEPSAGMNAGEKAELVNLIRRINEQLGKTVLLIEHDMRLVMLLSKWVTVLNQGQKIAEGTPAEIQENPLVIEAYLGKGYRRKD